MRYLAIVWAAALLAGCAQVYEPTTKSAPLTSGTAISTTASLTSTYAFSRDSDLITCSEPPPDASFSQGENAAFSLSFLNFGGEDDAAESEESEGVEMAGRTPGTMMARELFFRLCEFSRNYRLEKDEAKELYLKTLSAVAAGWKAEAQNTTISVGEQSSHTINQTITGDAPAISGLAAQGDGDDPATDMSSADGITSESMDAY